MTTGLLATRALHILLLRYMMSDTPSRGVWRASVNYSTHAGDSPNQAHINYECPCGCVAGVLYDALGQSEVGRCCCGRILVAGPDAQLRLQAALRANGTYDLDIGTVTLPWGHVVDTALAIPRER